MQYTMTLLCLLHILRIKLCSIVELLHGRADCTAYCSQDIWSEAVVCTAPCTMKGGGESPASISPLVRQASQGGVQSCQPRSVVTGLVVFCWGRTQVLAQLIQGHWHPLHLSHLDQLVVASWNGVLALLRCFPSWSSLAAQGCFACLWRFHKRPFRCPSVMLLQNWSSPLQ